jgi:hypothetical protein
MVKATSRLRARFLLFVVLTIVATTLGCGDASEDSRQQMHKLQSGLMSYADKHQGEWPDSLDQIKEEVGGEATFNELMTNPLTGANPGYEYVKPDAKSADFGMGSTTVVLYQLRDGQRDTTLKVGFADGRVNFIDTQ